VAGLDEDGDRLGRAALLTEELPEGPGDRRLRAPERQGAAIAGLGAAGVSAQQRDLGDQHPGLRIEGAEVRERAQLL
jgi:hypothetical protein